jgi:polyhydroxybutyrate depolymerase
LHRTVWIAVSVTLGCSSSTAGLLSFEPSSGSMASGGGGGTASEPDAAGQAGRPEGGGGAKTEAGLDAAPPSDAVPSDACASGAVKPADGYHDLQVGTEARRFLLHLPPAYDGRRAFPAIFTFHSKGDDATQFDSVKFYYQAAAGAANVLVYMEALPDPSVGGARSFERDPVDDLVYADAVVQWLKVQVCFDTGRMFALGHSNGATFVQDLACHRGHVFRAMATHSGNAGDTTGCDGPVAAWVAWGDLDNAGLVAVSAARAAFWALENGCDATSTSGSPAPPCIVERSCASGRSVESCEDPTGDHKWAAWMSDSTAKFFGDL